MPKLDDMRYMVERTVPVSAMPTGYGEVYKTKTHCTLMIGPFASRDDAVTYGVGHTHGAVNTAFKIHPVIEPIGEWPDFLPCDTKG